MPDTPAGPRQVIDQGETRYTLLGTAHVSRASADEVRELIRSGEFDAVAIELCPTRYQSATQPDAMAKMDLFQVLRQGKAGMVAASLALGAFQQRVAEQSGVTPGAEMQMAIIAWFKGILNAFKSSANVLNVFSAKMCVMS